MLPYGFLLFVVVVGFCFVLFFKEMDVPFLVSSVTEYAKVLGSVGAKR